MRSNSWRKTFNSSRITLPSPVLDFTFMETIPLTIESFRDEHY